MKFLRKITIMLVIVTATVQAKTMDNEYIVIAGSASQALTEQVAGLLDIKLANVKISKFNDGETQIKINENVRGKTAYIIQSTVKSEGASVNDNIMELYLLTRAFRRSSANKVVAIIPYYGYARQDRKNDDRVPISASDVAMLIENSGVDRVIALDLHCGQIQGFFHNVPVDDISGSTLFVPKFAELNLKEPVIVSPDAGGVGRAKKFREQLEKYGVQSDFAIIMKQRAEPGKIASVNLIGNVKDRDVIIVDDICDTGGTLVKAAAELKKFGCRDIYASITHPVFSQDAINKIENSEFKKVFVSDSIAIKSGNYKKIHQLSVAPVLAKVIANLNSDRSLSPLSLLTNEYIKKYGISKVMPYNKIYPSFRQGDVNLQIPKDKDIKVSIASQSNIKIKAVKEIFNTVFAVPPTNLSINSYAVESGVSEQPLGLQAALKGTKNRLQALKDSLESRDQGHSGYLIAIESFFAKTKYHNLPSDHALIMLEEPNGKQHIYLSPGVELANEVFKRGLAQKSGTIGEYMQQRYHVNANNWQGYVTNNKLDRCQQIVSVFNG